MSKSTSPPIKDKLYHKADSDSINSSLTKQLTILQDQILNLISSDNPDSINIINNAAIILTDSIMNIHNSLPEKNIKPNTSVPFSIQLLIKQKRKIKRAFIKTRNPYRKSFTLFCPNRYKCNHSKNLLTLSIYSTIFLTL